MGPLPLQRFPTKALAQEVNVSVLRKSCAPCAGYPSDLGSQVLRWPCKAQAAAVRALESVAVVGPAAPVVAQAAAPTPRAAPNSLASDLSHVWNHFDVPGFATWPLASWRFPN